MAGDEELRDYAIKAIKKKREFWGHAVAYIIVNAFFVVVWYFFSGAGYFWPGWIMAGWGIGLAFNAWDAYGRGSRPISEAEIQREIDRQKGA